MPSEYYKEALRLGQREFRACVGRGEHPYLPALEDFVSMERLSGGSDLGVTTVPLEFVVGTCHGGRTQAFARNYMPLMAEGSEFADKWRQLCKAHLEEGIHSPVRVYEYLNRYYVEEGNKRVSVLKFFGGQTVEARVFRVLPEKNGSREAELYYELLDFSKYSGVRFLEFSKPGRYATLQRLMGKAPEEPWTEEERKKFTSAYYYFRQAYEANGGKKLSTTVGDALLAYVKVYGYPRLKNYAPADLRRTVAKAWEEIALQQEVLPIDVKLTPPEDRGEGLLSKVFKGKEEPMKVAFLHDKNPISSGWTHGHELGRQHLERVFPTGVETTAYFDVLLGEPEKTLEKAIQDGNTVLFTTSPRLLPASLRSAVEHPEVTIFNCSLNMSHRYVRTYYARMYEAKFIIGAVAGSLAGNNPVGYVCDYPIYGQVAGINAFALGARMVNPRVKVYLEWSSLAEAEGAGAAVERLRRRGVSLISSQDLVRLEEMGSRACGLSLFSDSGQVNLAMPVWNWGVYYESILRRLRSGALKHEYEGSSKALNYYWGMSAGVVGVSCTDKVPPETQKLAWLLQDGVCSGVFEPFSGPIYTQDGTKVAQDHRSLSPEQIINMDYLAEGIEGSIPAYEALSELGKATVRIAGIGRAAGEAEGA